MTMTTSTAKYCTNIKTQNTTVGWTCTSNSMRGKTKAPFRLKGYQNTTVGSIYGPQVLATGVRRFNSHFCALDISTIFFDVLLTVHLSIFISVFNQLDAQNLFHSKFHFMPLHVSSTCAHCITQLLVSSHLYL